MDVFSNVKFSVGSFGINVFYILTVFIEKEVGGEEGNTLFLFSLS